SAGTHPHDAESNVNEVDKFSCLLKKESCRAVGEIGLDYFYENSDRGKQIQVFKKFLGLSLSFELPAIVHCRDADDSETAYEDAGALLKPFAAAGGRFVVHCFTGTTHWAEKFLEWGAYIGITGIVTFPKAENVREVAAMIPNERLLLETDSPYLAPVPFRGKTNHSKYLPVVAEKIAEVRNTDPAEIAATTTRNAFELFASKY
ncbi:MAG: TatD family hydrolase, partial [Victivallales bacterium]|nr:TatD family hydrolase [Victivallales bacterium]